MANDAPCIRVASVRSRAQRTTHHSRQTIARALCPHRSVGRASLSQSCSRKPPLGPPSASGRFRYDHHFLSPGHDCARAATVGRSRTLMQLSLAFPTADGREDPHPRSLSGWRWGQARPRRERRDEQPQREDWPLLQRLRQIGHLLVRLNQARGSSRSSSHIALRPCRAGLSTSRIWTSCNTASSAATLHGFQSARRLASRSGPLYCSLGW